MTDSEEIVENSEKLFLKAFASYKEMNRVEGEEKLNALMDIPTYARASTRTLHKLKSNEDDWEEWWEDRRQVLEEDPICSYMWKLRNNILKEGDANTVNSASFNNIGPGDLPPIPEWADSMFLGDQYGGSGYTVEGPDGDEVKIYVDFDIEGIDVNFHFDGLQTELDEGELPETTVEEASKYYLRIIRESVSDAKSKWGGD